MEEEDLVSNFEQLHDQNILLSKEVREIRAKVEKATGHMKEL